MRRSVIAAVIFGLVGTAVLAALGAWQVKRLAWKEDIIARLEARLAAAPVALPEQLDRERDGFLRVRVTGHVGDGELHVLTSQKPHGPGFRVIAPLIGPAGRTILVDLGYVPEVEKDGRARPAGEGDVVGALYWPDEIDGFTPAPDRAANIWFARDLEAMAQALETEPVLVIAESHTGLSGAGDWPKPLRLGVNLPNDHLQYALTWFSLALIWAVMSTMLVGRERKRQDELP